MRRTVLLPLEVLEGESIPEGVPELLGNARVVLLGYHHIPEQTAPGQAQMQFEDRANDRLADLAELLEAAGATVETRMVFTHDPQETIDRVLEEYDCDAALVPGATGPVERVLVGVRGGVGEERLASVVAGLFADGDARVTLLHVTSAEQAGGEEVLADAVAELEAQGVESERIDTNLITGEEVLESIVEAAAAHDVVVMGETDPSLSTYVFGMPADQVADRFLGPVLVAQRTPTEEE